MGNRVSSLFVFTMQAQILEIQQFCGVNVFFISFISFEVILSILSFLHTKHKQKRVYGCRFKPLYTDLDHYPKTLLLRALLTSAEIR